MTLAPPRALLSLSLLLPLFSNTCIGQIMERADLIATPPVSSPTPTDHPRDYHQMPPLRSPLCIPEDGNWAGDDIPLPSFELVDLDGRKWHLNDLRGKVVFVGIWATWCGLCQDEFEDYEAVARAFEERKQVLVVTMNVDPEDKLDLARKLVARKELTLPVILARDLVFEVAVKPSLPRKWILGRSAAIRRVEVGHWFPAQESNQSTAVTSPDIPWLDTTINQINQLLGEPTNSSPDALGDASE